MFIWVTVVPLLYIILGGVRSTAQISANSTALPNPWVFRTTSAILKSAAFWGEFGNSAIVGVVTTVARGARLMASFALARYEFRKGRMSPCSSRA